MGPGSLFTSVIPNLLVSGIPNAIRKSRAMKAYFVNLMSQPGETTDFSASDHVEAIRRHAKGQLIDCAVMNTGRISSSLRRRYEETRATPCLTMWIVCGVWDSKCRADLLDDSGPKVRHDPAAIASVALELARRAANADIPELCRDNVSAVDDRRGDGSFFVNALNGGDASAQFYGVRVLAEYFEPATIPNMSAKSK